MLVHHIGIRGLSKESTPKIYEMLCNLDEQISAFDVGLLSVSKRAILEAFIKIATFEGYSAVTMRSLARTVNLKPPTIYSHFEAGKEQIVSEALKLHIYTYGTAIYAALENCNTAKSYWDALIKMHVKQMLTMQENEMWDLFISMERINKALGEEVRQQVLSWSDFCDSMYQAIAVDLGFECSIEKSRVIRQILDSTARWWNWDGSEDSLIACGNYASKISLTLLAMSD